MAFIGPDVPAILNQIILKFGFLPANIRLKTPHGVDRSVSFFEKTRGQPSGDATNIEIRKNFFK
jgi:hypothetical protein